MSIHNDSEMMAAEIERLRAQLAEAEKALESADSPHVRAAFINAIAEEGTKAEAVEYLQKQWNETCRLRAKLAEAEKALIEAREYIGLDNNRRSNRVLQSILLALKPDGGGNDR